MLELLADPNVWVAFATLTVMEIVLGIDNIVFISVLVSRLPRAQADRARRLGLALALIFRILLLLVISWIIGLTHPVVSAFGLELSRGSLHPTAPFPYPQMVAAVTHSVGVVTDSGGLQKEAFLLGAPCTTLRTETEWTETLEDGWNILDPDLSRVTDVAVRERPTAERSQPYGDGAAAVKVVDALLGAERDSAQG